MAADLRSTSLFGRASLILMDDRLVRLDHGRTKDRIRSVFYDGVESVVFWQRTRWVTAVIALLAFVVPGLIVSSSAAVSTLGQNIALFTLIPIGVILAGWTGYCPKYTMRIVRGGKNTDLVGIYRPGKFNRFRERLVSRIRAADEAARRRMNESAAPTAASSPPTLPS